MSLLLTVLGLLLVVGGWLHYLHLIPREAVPAQPRQTSALLALGMAAGCVGAGLGETWLPWALYASTATLGLFFFWLLAQRHTPTGALTVSVGEGLPPIVAKTSAGEVAEWPQGRVLFKLFRGHW